jgi:phosphatidylethanolamine-binding protein (PEBP) family uncharacterized protein
MYRDSFLVRKLFLILLVLFAFSHCTQSSNSSSSKNALAAAALYSYSTSSATTNKCTSASSSTTLTLSSTIGVSGSAMSSDYACTLYGGLGYSPDLSWSGCPSTTKELALIMTTIALDGTKYNWILYGIPTTVSTLAKNTTGVGTAGLGSDGPNYGYQAPCSSGLGTKDYTFTMYALSATPTLSGVVTGSVLTSAISSTTLAKGSITLTYTR